MRHRIECLVTLVLAGLAGCETATSPSATNVSTSGTDDGGAPPTDLDGGEADGAGPNRSTFAPFPDEDTFSCATPPLAAGLHPGSPVDYIEVRGPFPPYVDAGSGTDERFQSKAGVACATAADKPACESALRTAFADGWEHVSCGPPFGTETYLVYTRGDTVGTAGSAADVVALLAPIDSPEEARAVLLATEHVDLHCRPEGPASGVRQNADGSFEIITRYGACPETRKRFRVAPDGTVSTLATQRDGSNCVCGRRFDGLLGSAEAGGAKGSGAQRGLGPYFAELAHLEAASVIAFRRFEAELRELAAPEELLAAARAARADEIRHAATMAAVARRFGCAPPPVEAAPPRARSAFDIALENRVEGCVRETYGAIVAAYQARAAAAPELREVFRGIARDEAAHAELAHAVAAWLEPQLTAAERAAIDDAASAELDRLFLALGARAHADVLDAAGVPDVDVARQLLLRMGSLANAA